MNGATNIIIQADAAYIPLPGGKVHTVVTSPPYWSLRKYAGAQDRDWPAVEYAPQPGLPPITVEALDRPVQQSLFAKLEALK